MLQKPYLDEAVKQVYAQRFLYQVIEFAIFTLSVLLFINH